MKILAFDTSNSFCSAGIYIDGKLATKYSELSNSQAISLLPFIQELILGSRIGDLDYIISTNGPGSFTGTRIGISALLGFKISKPHICLATINSLAAIYINFFAISNSAETVLVINEAIGGQVYYQYFRNKKPLSETPLISFLDQISILPEKLTILGNSKSKLITSLLHNYIIFEKTDMSLVAQFLATNDFATNELLFNFKEIKPIYLREPSISS